MGPINSKTVAVFVLLALLSGCSPSPNSSHAGEASATRNAERLAEYDRQLAHLTAQQAESDRQLAIADGQQKRMDALLTRWEKQADRRDALLDAEEKRRSGR
jgi:hypothetical protein